MIRVPRGTLTIVLVVATVLASCAAVTEPLTPLATPPNLLGKWKGEWGGTMNHPIELVVEKQERTNVSGAYTFLRPGHSPSTHRMTGTVGAKPDGSVWALMDVEGREFSLNVVSERRLEGTGRSHQHYGPVTLSRE